MCSQLDPNLLALKQKTGYNTVQENGQRKTGPPPFWTGPPPPKGCEVFIGKLPRNVFEDELFPLFQSAGVIYEFRLMMDFSSSNRGFAFVTYANKSDALRAIQMLNGFEIRPGRRIGVLKSVDNCRLYIGGIPTDKSKEEIYAEISKYTSGVSDVIIYACPVNKTKNRGFAFIEYESHRAASMARKILIPGNLKLFDCEIIVDWATPEPEIDEDQMKLVTTLYVRNVPFHISEGYLLYLFSVQGSLSVSRIKKIKDFAFVHYFSRQDAEVALTKLNGINLSGSIIDVTWAKPPSVSHVPEKTVEIHNLSEQRLVPYSAESVPAVNKASANILGLSPAKVLYLLCLENGWGEPLYQITHTSSSADEVQTTFASKVYIPRLPSMVKYFAPSGIFYSPREAKNCAADCALQHIALMSKFQSFPETPIAASPRPLLSPFSNFGQNSIWGPSSIWKPIQDDISVSQNAEFLDQDSFFNMLSSAALLASVQLQSSAKMDQTFRSQSMY